MHLPYLSRLTPSHLVNSQVSVAFGARVGTQCHSRAFCALPRLDRFSRPSSAVHRRQLLNTTSLSLLSSWLPFSTMSAKAAFELPGEKWWSEETVAVVTGGEFAAPLSCHCSLCASEQGDMSAANKGIGYGIAKLLASQGLLTVVAARNGEVQYRCKYLIMTLHVQTLNPPAWSLQRSLADKLCKKFKTAQV